MNGKALPFYRLSSSLFLAVLILSSFFLPFRADGSWAVFPVSLTHPTIENGFQTSLVIPLCVGTIGLFLSLARLFLKRKDGAYPLVSLSLLSMGVALVSAAAAIMALLLKTPHYPLGGYFGAVAFLSFLVFVLDVRSKAIERASEKALTAISLSLSGFSVLAVILLALQPFLLLIC